MNLSKYKSACLYGGVVSSCLITAYVAISNPALAEAVNADGLAVTYLPPFLLLFAVPGMIIGVLAQALVRRFTHDAP